MKYLNQVLLIVAIAFSTAALAYDNGVNLVQNSNFSIGLPVNWTRDAFKYSDNLFSWDQNSKQVRVSVPAGSPNDARWVQTVPVEANTDYVLSGYIRTKDVEHSTEIVQAGANLSILDDLPGTGFFTFSEPLFGNHGWTYRELRFNTGSNTQIRIALRVGMFAGTATGTAWFRSIKLNKAP
jgi:hypothetical protein